MTSTEVEPARALRRSVAALPPLLMALLPKVACPACWPAYGGVLSSLGLGGLLASPWRVPLFVGFVLPALWLLARGCQRQRRWWPLLLAVVGATASLLGTWRDHTPTAFAGSAAFFAAVLGSAIVRRPRSGTSQPDGPASLARCCRRA